MKRNILIIVMMVFVIMIVATGCSSNNSTKVPTTNAQDSTTSTATETPTTVAVSTTSDQDGDGIPDAIEKTYGSNPYKADTDGDNILDKDDNNPNFADMPFKLDGGAMQVKIIDARVEDNATDDHLEITLQNTSNDPISNIDAYFTITDKKDQTMEAYFQNLTNLTIKAGEKITVHFDNQSAPGHYFGNMNGLYGTSINGLTFNVTLHDSQNNFIQFLVEKSEGAAEVAD